MMEKISIKLLKKEGDIIKYSCIKKNDIANGDGVCVSFWTQGCDIRCSGCHNASIWDFEGGRPFTAHTMYNILEAIRANNVTRNFSVLGGEPLTERNLAVTEYVVTTVREHYPDIKIFLWTGYRIEDFKDCQPDSKIARILQNCDILIDGPYIEAQRDIRLHLRGSTNQRVINLKKTIAENRIIMEN